MTWDEPPGVDRRNRKGKSLPQINADERGSEPEEKLPELPKSPELPKFERQSQELRAKS
jgi:hypothetical protein